MRLTHFSFFTGIAIALVFTGCVAEEDTTTPVTSAVSSIVPKPPLVSGKQRISLQTPLNTVTLSAADTQFTFNASEPRYATVLIFSESPAATSTGITDMSKCVAGVTSMNPAHVSYSDYSITLGYNAGTGGFYSCDPSNATEPLSSSQKLSLSELTGSSTYYWVVLGYNDRYLLTHSSEIRPFTTP